MIADAYLTLDQAAKLLRRSKREMRELVRSGRIPAVRQDARWLVLKQDLAGAHPTSRSLVQTAALSGDVAKSIETAPVDTPRDEILAFISLVRDRDEQLSHVQDERARLAGQVGYLQAQLADRDARLALLETVLASRTPQLAAHPDGDRSIALVHHRPNNSSAEISGHLSPASATTAARVEDAAEDLHARVAFDHDADLAPTPDSGGVPHHGDDDPSITNSGHGVQGSETPRPLASEQQIELTSPHTALHANALHVTTGVRDLPMFARSRNAVQSIRRGLRRKLS